MPVKNTGALLQKLRSFMKNSKYVSKPIHAYIVPSGDAHMSEYIAACDKRRECITGFTGSAGTAVITEKEAALWTDGRYFLQASSQLDENWTLMKMGLKETPTKGEWLIKQLPVGGNVGIDPSLYAAATWEPLEKELNNEGFGLIPVSTNLIDLVWPDRPPAPTNGVFALNYKYTGKKWQEKVVDLQKKMREKNASVLVVTALDDIAWLLNLRGSDVEFNPVFFSYVILTLNSLLFFVNEKKLSKEVRAHLVDDKISVSIKPYDEVYSELSKLVSSTTSKIWVSDKSSQSLYSLVPEKRRLNQPSPIAVMKAVKNPVEIQGMKNAHIKDSVALCEYFCWLEKQITENKVITEISGLQQLQKFRKKQEVYVSESFDTISSVGPNAAIIHYRASDETDRPITKEDVYLCDSGAQYLDGTTDVTRTLHFGTPTRHQQECFTRVLKGHIGLGSVIFPNDVKGVMLDTIARMSLWEVGLDYMHGTGHGVGSFLNVHEGPCGIGMKPRQDDAPIEAGMILSNEPGYYEDEKFGIRIESLVVAKSVETKFNFRDKGFLSFETITLVPIQQKMILPELLTEKEIQWLNSFHEACREVVGEEMKKQGKTELYNWLLKETLPIG